VRSNPSKLATEAELYAAALRALMRRAHSVHEMKELLARLAEEEKLVRPVLEKLKHQQYLDDARYALDYARHHAQSCRQGKFRIARELRGRGVPDRHIEVALDAIFAETDESSLVRERLKRMSKSGGALNERKIASFYRSLLRAGFSGDVIRTEIRALKADIAELPETADNGL
jgi:regulatory protein